MSICSVCSGVYTFQLEGDKGTIVEATSIALDAEEDTLTCPTFEPQPLLNLAMVQDLESMAPVRSTVTCIR